MCFILGNSFIPKKVPDYIIEVDNKDKKLFLSFIDKTSQYITSYINFNLTNNPYLNKNAPDYFEKVHHIINKSNNYKKVVVNIMMKSKIISKTKLQEMQNKVNFRDTMLLC